MSEPIVGDLVAAFLEACGVDVAFGVISIHNMPMLDALHRRGRVRFVPARGEAGAAAMADAAARVSGKLGVVFTSTGTAAGNAAGALVEAATAGTPLLHITAQIDSPFLDRNFGYIHEARDQPGMLGAICKAAFRVNSTAEAMDTLQEAACLALTAPQGPVSVELPIDLQWTPMALPGRIAAPERITPAPDEAALDELAERFRAARRPLLWLGGGARDAAGAVARLAGLGIGVVTSAAGRGILPEDQALSLGAFGAAPSAEELYRNVDLMLVAGSHLRSNETRTYNLKLPPIVRIDADPAAAGRPYRARQFICADAALALEGLARRLAAQRPAIDPDFAAAIAAARRAAEAGLRCAAGPYAPLLDMLADGMPRDALWVRDITMSNSIWGNRVPPLRSARQGVHAMGGGIGLGLPMAVGAGLGGGGRKVVALVGDGGLALSLGELATAAESGADIALLLMNDGGYGVIRDIQDVSYAGRRAYADLKTPRFGLIAESLGVPHRAVGDLAQFPAAFAGALQTRGLSIVEIDMKAIGPFAIKGGSFPPPPAVLP